jgi:hypothetical protein
VAGLPSIKVGITEMPLFVAVKAPETVVLYFRLSFFCEKPVVDKNRKNMANKLIWRIFEIIIKGIC